MDVLTRATEVSSYPGAFVSVPSRYIRSRVARKGLWLHRHFRCRINDLGKLCMPLGWARSNEARMYEYLLGHIKARRVSCVPTTDLSQSVWELGFRRHSRALGSCDLPWQVSPESMNQGTWLQEKETWNYLTKNKKAEGIYWPMSMKSPGLARGLGRG